MNVNDFFEQIAAYVVELRIEAGERGFLRSLRQRFAAVWSLISRIPLPRAFNMQITQLPTAIDMTMLPPAGALLALISTLPAVVLALILPDSLAAWIGCAIYALFGWSLHLDGWGDLWDGIGSGQRGEKMRQIMKDSRTGSFGVIALITAIGFRAVSLSAMPLKSWLAGVIVAAVAGRFACLVAAYMGRYPWTSGMGRNIVSDFDGYYLFCGFVVCVPFFLLAPLGWTLGMAAASAVGTGMARFANGRLGGTNGDVLGAAAVAGELIALIFLVF